MKNNVLVMLTCIGLGISVNSAAASHGPSNSSRLNVMETTHSYSSDCRIAPARAEYYCNVVLDNAQCRYWLNVVRSCGLPVEV